MSRTTTAILLIVVTGLALISHWVSCLVVIALISAGLYEFFKMVEKKGIRPYQYFGMAMGIAIPLSIAFKFELTRNWEFFFIICALVALILLQLSRRKNLGAVVDISTTIFGILYISWCLSFIIKIRNLDNGVGLLASLLLITKMGDIGAYLIGSRFGKTPLMPYISPKKTWEGAFGGLLFSILAALISAKFLRFSYPHLIFMGGFIGIIGQLGDLSESLFKRDCQVKDSGNIFPGLGGALDIVDSLFFTAPVFYLYMVIKII